jgi:hypothetical protein
MNIDMVLRERGKVIFKGMHMPLKLADDTWKTLNKKYDWGNNQREFERELREMEKEITQLNPRQKRKR